MTGLVWFICCAAWTPHAHAEDHALGVPDTQSIDKAKAFIKRTYSEEYAAARTPQQRAALAARLLREGVQTKDNPPARYVLLCEARDLAARSGDATTACRSIEHLARHYGVAPGEMALSALSEVSRTALTSAAYEALARCAMAAVDQAILRDEYDLASRHAALSLSAAERSKKITLIDEAQDKVREVTWAKSEHDRAKAALDTLGARPDDRDAKSAAGKFRCLVKGDWERGLAMLLEGADVAYRNLAAADLAAINADPSAQARTGDQWWEHGDTLPARARSCCRARAAHWYRRCVSKLSGVTKTSVEKRLEGLERERMRELRLEPGLAAEVFAGENFAKPLLKRVDPNLDFDWEGAPGDGDGLPKDKFSIRWTGQLRVQAGGSHTLILHVNLGAKVFIDDQLVIDEPDGSHKRNGRKHTLNLSEGLHSIRVDFRDAGGIARIRLLWITPTSPAEEPIPPSAFYHEIGADQ
jgi:hypothetical protein